MKKLIYILLLMLVALPVVHANFNVELLDTDPAPIKAGEYADITLRYTANSDDITRNNVIVKVRKTPYLLPLDESEVMIKKIYPGESVTRTFRVYFSEDLPQGYVNVPFDISYNGIITEAYVEVFIQEGDSNPEMVIGDVEVTPSELLPDTKDNKLTITLQNLGDKDADLVKAELVVDKTKIEPSYSFSFLDNIASVSSGGEGDLQFDLDVNEDIYGEIPAMLKLRYRAEKSVGGNYDIFEKNLSFNIPISNAPYLKVTNVEQLDAFTLGSAENRVRVTIRNDGTEDADEVRIRALPDISYPFAYEITTEYVTSKIKPGEEATVEFKMEVLDKAEVKNYSTTVKIESLVGETRYSREDSITITTSEGSKKSNYEIAAYGIILVFVISFYLGYLKIREKRKKSKK